MTTTPLPPAPAAAATPVPSAAPEKRAETLPKAIVMPNPVYPEKALRERVRGLVILRVQVSETGEPLVIEVEREARKDLTDAAIAAARHWKFEPATKDGHPVRGVATLRFPFEGIQFARTPLP